MPRPIVIDGQVLSRSLVEPSRGAVCRLDICGGGCCGGGIWVDVLQVQRILAHTDAIAALLAPERRDPDDWFSDEVMDHADFPSGVGTATAVGPRPDGSGRQGCTFLLDDNCCALQRVSEANDLGYECLLLEDCTGATDFGNYRAAIKMVKMQGGVFGSVSNSQHLLTALDNL